MTPLPTCPHCQSSHTYLDGPLVVCPECGHEWSAQGPEAAAAEEPHAVRDAVGKALQDGDTVMVIKDLKI